MVFKKPSIIVAILLMMAAYIAVCSTLRKNPDPEATAIQLAQNQTDLLIETCKMDSDSRQKGLSESQNVRQANYESAGSTGESLENPHNNAHPAAQRRYPLRLSSKIPAEQLAELQDLPAACLTDLPGLGSQHPLLDNKSSLPGTQNPAIQSSSTVDDRPQSDRNFGWPKSKSPETDWQDWDSIIANNEQKLKNHSAGLASYNPHAKATAARKTGVTESNTIADGKDPHAEVFSRTLYPSADECRTCHQQVYDEWAGSGHAYASISPMFQRFEDKINQLSQGTIGYFCLRCHAPVATTMKLRRDQAIWDGPKVFREGVTCVACHRVSEAYNKTNGERRIEPGDAYQPVYGGSDGIGVAKAVRDKEFYKVKVDPNDPRPAQPMHRRSIKFEQLSQSSFCMSCHQVAVQPGIKLEVVWDQYRASPAYRKGTTCQDCHMGHVPGRPEGYAIGPAAVVNNRAVNTDRKHSNHLFYGPGYSIAHPGIFPHTPDSDRWTVNQWLQFDWRSGWGTQKFEDAVAEGKIKTWFPSTWREPDDRMDARIIIDRNLKKLAHKKEIRRKLFENSSRVDGPFFARDPQLGKSLKFHYCVTSLNSGHNMPSGSLGAQPQLWLNVALINPDGQRIWESGYLDSNGDLADLHSLDVQSRRIALDKQLFNLQSKFLVTNVKGTDREMPLPLNFDIDQLPFLRPAPQPVSVINHPPTIRMENHSIPPLGSRKAKYIVPAHLIQQPGVYRLSVRMRSRAEPIYFMRFVGATPEMERMMNQWMADSHAYTVTFEVK